MTPNITIRSNIYIRIMDSIKEDRKFISQVRGRAALKRLLRIVGASEDTPGFLTARQRAEIRWEVPCSLCHSYPEGAVVRDGLEMVVFRCPRGHCTGSTTVARTVLLSRCDLSELMSKTGAQSPSAAVEVALSQWKGGVPETRREPSSDLIRLPLRLSLTRAQLLDDVTIGALIRDFVGLQG